MVDIKEGNTIIWSLERTINSSNMVLSTSKDTLEEYQIKMIQNNQILNLIKPQIKFNNNTGFLYYPISGKLTLLEYANQYLINYEVLKNLIETLIDNFSILNEYLLHEENLLIDVHKIFIDVENKEFSFIYIPTFNSNIKNNNEIKELIQELFKYIHKNDEKAIGFIHKLKIIMEEDCFNIFSLTAITNLEENIIQKKVVELIEENVDKENNEIASNKEKKSRIFNFIIKKRIKSNIENRSKWNWGNIKNKRGD